MSIDDAEKISSAWIRDAFADAIVGVGRLPIIPLPNTDRDDGRWWLGIDRKHEGTTVLLYCDMGGGKTSHRRIATLKTRAELLTLYQHLTSRIVVK